VSLCDFSVDPGVTKKEELTQRITEETQSSTEVNEDSLEIYNYKAVVLLRAFKLPLL
jgi:hypothetical protein